MAQTPTVLLNAIDLPCPRPVIEAKRYWEEHHRPFAIQVNLEIAVENLFKWARSNGLLAEKELGDAGVWTVSFSLPDPDPQGEEKVAKTAFATTGAAPISPSFGRQINGELNPPLSSPQLGCGLFVGKDHVGEGDPELGETLAKMLFYTLTATENRPQVIAFMNSGVFLVARDSEIQFHLRSLQEAGTRILICGTCLNFYHLSPPEDLGEVSNFYEIWEALTAAGSVVSL